MLKVALTGGIATGKSGVLERFRRRGVPVIDADRLVHQALAGGTAVSRAVAARFGPGVVAPDGAIERRKLAALVFSDSAARQDLESMVHPEVYRAVEAWFAERSADGTDAFGVADIPLLYETGRASSFDRVIVATCDPELQVRRIVARDGLSESEARQRLAAQWPIADKVSRADFVIWTDGSMEKTDRQVDEVVRTLQSKI